MKPGLQLGEGEESARCVRVCESVGGDGLESEQRRGQGNRGAAPGRPRRSPRFSRGGARSPAPLTMDLRRVGTRLGSSARVTARPWGCAGARAGMAR